MTQLKVFPNYVFLKEIQNSFSIEHIWISVSANGKIFQLLIPTPHACTANMPPPLSCAIAYRGEGGGGVGRGGGKNSKCSP